MAARTTLALADGLLPEPESFFQTRSDSPKVTYPGFQIISADDQLTAYKYHLSDFSSLHRSLPPAPYSAHSV